MKIEEATRVQILGALKQWHTFVKSDEEKCEYPEDPAAAAEVHLSVIEDYLPGGAKHEA